jgi:hypothetical protein
MLSLSKHLYGNSNSIRLSHLLGRDASTSSA